MSKTSETQDRTATESNYDDYRPKKDNVIYLYPQTTGDVTGQLDDSINYQANMGRRNQLEQPIIRKDFRDKISFDQIRSKVDYEIIDFAYNSIVDAFDYEIDRIERSNFFDEWKDTLETIMAEVINISVNHRKILGALIVAAKGKDLVNFNKKELRLMIDATYMLRQLRVTKSDSKRIIKNLIDSGAEMAIPLAVEEVSEKEEEDLDKMMKSLIKRSK